MLEKPALRDENIVAALRDGYGLSVTQLEFLPVGYDSSAWVYRVESESGRYFLKVKRGEVYAPSLRLPRYLHDTGIEQVVAPLPTVDGALSFPVDDFTLILYPFIDGETGMAAGLSEQQWTAFGAVLKHIHTAALPPGLLAAVPREAFRLNPKWLRLVRAFQASLPTRQFDNPYQRELAAYWNARRGEIGRIADRAEALGRMLQKRESVFFLCHADIHTANVLVDAVGALHIVDWDQPVIAPKERDLMFVVGSAGAGRLQLAEEAAFFKGYGAVAIDPLALAYYRYEWVVQELGDFGERVFLLDDVGEETRADSLHGFKQLFELGDVVEAAYRADEALA